MSQIDWIKYVLVYSILLVAYWGLVKFSNTKFGARIGAKVYTYMMNEFDEFKKLAEKYNEEMRK